MRHKALSRRRFAGWGRIVLLSILGVVVGSAPALAKPAGKRIAVVAPSDGTAKDAVITAKIAKTLKQHQIQAITGAPVKKALGKGGPLSSDDDWSVLARRLKVDGAIESTVSQTGAKRKIEVIVRNGADGAVVERATFAAKGPPAKLAAAVAAGFWKKLGVAVKATTPPLKTEGGAGKMAREAPASEVAPAPSVEKTEEAASPASEPEEASPSERAEKSEQGDKPAAANEREAADGPDASGDEPERSQAVRRRPKAGKETPSTGPRTVEVELGGRVLQRLFEYTPASAAQAYVKRSMPVLMGRVAWFPITYAGVFLSGEVATWLTTGSNPAYPTGTRELLLGAQGRYPISFGVLGLSAAYFQHLFILGDTSDGSDAARTSLAWPDVAYQGVRLAANGRFYLGDMFQAGAEAAYRLVTNPGAGTTGVRSSFYFPNGTAAGLDGSAFVGMTLMSWLELRAAVDYRRYAFGTLAPGPDNANNINASGATDQYLGFSLSAVGVFGGR